MIAQKRAGKQHMLQRRADTASIILLFGLGMSEDSLYRYLCLRDPTCIGRSKTVSKINVQCIIQKYSLPDKGHCNLRSSCVEQTGIQ